MACLVVATTFGTFFVVRWGMRYFASERVAFEQTAVVDMAAVAADTQMVEGSKESQEPAIITGTAGATGYDTRIHGFGTWFSYFLWQPFRLAAGFPARDDPFDPGIVVPQWDDGRIAVGNGDSESYWVHDDLRVGALAIDDPRSPEIVVLVSSDLYMIFRTDAEEMIDDLATRGLLDETLVVWFGDFGRTPKVNPTAGRDHWSTAGVAFLAGGGLKVGQVVGATNALAESTIGSCVPAVTNDGGYADRSP